MTATLLLAATAAVTLAQVQTMPPAALGDALLAERHRPIVETSLRGGGPPPPPGAPTTTEVRLWDAGRDGRVAGFCERARYAVTLAPVRVRPDGTRPAARAATVARSTDYRWKPTGPGATCAARYDDYFAIHDPREAPAIFAAIRLLAQAQRDPAPGLGGGVDDVLAREAIAMAAKDADYAAHLRTDQPELLVPVTDWRAALARFPISTIGSVRIRARWSHDDPRVVLWAGGSWIAGLRIVERRLADVAFRRMIPAPF